MPTQEPSRLWFELNTGSDSIVGQMHADGNPTRSFHSWLELVALIEEMRDQRSQPNPHRGVVVGHSEDHEDEQRDEWQRRRPGLVEPAD
jgi:hypothetical protein